MFWKRTESLLLFWWGRGVAFQGEESIEITENPLIAYFGLFLSAWVVQGTSVTLSSSTLGIPNPRSRTPNPKSQTPDPKSQTPDPSCHIPAPSCKAQSPSADLLGEAGAHRVLGVAKGGALEHGCGQLQHFPQELIKLAENHQPIGI